MAICILWFVLPLGDLKDDTQEVKLSLWIKSLGIEFKNATKNTFYILVCPIILILTTEIEQKRIEEKKIDGRYLLSV